MGNVTMLGNTTLYANSTLPATAAAVVTATNFEGSMFEVTVSATFVNATSSTPSATVMSGSSGVSQCLPLCFDIDNHANGIVEISRRRRVDEQK